MVMKIYICNDDYDGWNYDCSNGGDDKCDGGVVAVSFTNYPFIRTGLAPAGTHMGPGPFPACIG